MYLKKTIWLSIFLTSLSIAQTFDYYALHGTGDYFDSVKYRIYLPDSIETIQGIYCFFAWPLASEDDRFREVCKKNNFALMESRYSFGSENYYDEYIGASKTVIRALNYFANITGHPELKFVPLFVEGYSAGAWLAYDFIFWKPEIVFGFICQKFKPQTFNTGPAKNVPGYFFYDVVQNLDPTEAYDLNRSKGAVWTIAKEPNGDHNQIVDRSILVDYFNDILNLRHPGIINQDKYTPLKTIEESVGWLGDRTTFFIAPYDSFPGNKQLASWMPGEHAAIKWKKFVSGEQGNKTSDNPDRSMEQDIIFKDNSFAAQSVKTAASFIGENKGDNAGYSISSAGDVNGDGFNDILIGAQGKDDSGLSKTNTGKVYLILGKALMDWGMDYNLSDADASFVGENGGNYSGCSVAPAGDVNGDDYDDFLIGARGNRDNGNNSGKAYLLLGRSSADWGKDFNLSDADASFSGEQINDWAGAHVSSAGDVNNDGFHDFIISSEGNDSDSLNQNTGKIYLFLGRSEIVWDKNFNLAGADASFIGESAGDCAGYSVSGAGDINGDGLSDLLIGTKLNFSDDAQNDSKTYLVLGRSSADWGINYNLSAADASFIGEKRFDRSGFSVSSAGDVNGDNYSDILIGAHDNCSSDLYSGKTYLILGKPEADWGMNFSLSNADADFSGEDAFDMSAFSVASTGDVNGDSLDDFIIGAPNNSSYGEFSGKAYLVNGRKDADWSKHYSLSNAKVFFTGVKQQDLFGYSVANAGDMNNDGYKDFLISALEIGTESGGTGKVYLISGYDIIINVKAAEIPKTSTLFQNYPNPFNSATIIKYDLGESGLAKLEVFDILGQKIKTLIEEIKPAGSYEIEFLTNDLTSGIYIYSLRTENFNQIKKFVILK